MFELVYASAATRPFSPKELEVLLTRARSRNQAAGVSGLLLHHEGAFLQVLEGEEGAVTEIFDRVGKDPRHTSVLVLRRGPVEARTFGDWEMGFVPMDERVAAELPGYSSFLKAGVLRATVSDGERVRRVLHQFREGRWRQRVR